MANLTIPPYRAALLTNGDGAPVIRAGANGDGDTIMTERHWYMFWRDVADQINAGAQAIDSLEGLVTSGNHADRPDARYAHEGALYIERDRGSVIYQKQGGVWQYVAGIMYGTLVPDQRPADLGPAADAGFQFRTNGDPARAFAWSGGAWIETTPERFGTHAQRLAETIANLVSGMLWMETDRSNTVYQNQAGVWVYVAGTMTGLFANRPTGLGTADTGFRFESTDTNQTFRWSGVAWVDLTPAAAPQNSLQFVGSSGNYTLTTAMADVPGLTLSLTRTGVWLIGIFLDCILNTGDANIEAQLLVNGGAQPFHATFGITGGAGRGTIGQQWSITIGAASTVKIQASKQSGSAGSFLTNLSTFSALWVAP